MFRFKEFDIEDASSAMKVGTDGVLLGAWCRIGENDRRVLDIGTGSGVVAIMVAQRSEGVVVDAIDIDEGSVSDARFNAANSLWKNRLNVINSPVQKYADNELNMGVYDHIVSNPPYFVDSLKCPDKARTNARHTDTLGFDDLIAAADRLLKPEGRLSLILPAAEAEIFIEQMTGAGFGLSRRTNVYSDSSHPVVRVLMEITRGSCDVELGTLMIRDSRTKDFSEEYKSLTRDFYLKF